MGQRSNDEPQRRNVEGQGRARPDDDRSLIARQWIGLVSADGHWRWDGQRWEPNTAERADRDGSGADPTTQPARSATHEAAAARVPNAEVTLSELDDWLFEPWSTRRQPERPDATGATPADESPEGEHPAAARTEWPDAAGSEASMEPEPPGADDESAASASSGECEPFAPEDPAAAGPTSAERKPPAPEDPPASGTALPELTDPGHLELGQPLDAPERESEPPPDEFFEPPEAAEPDWWDPADVHDRLPDPDRVLLRPADQPDPAPPPPAVAGEGAPADPAEEPDHQPSAEDRAVLRLRREEHAEAAPGPAEGVEDGPADEQQAAAPPPTDRPPAQALPPAPPAAERRRFGPSRPSPTGPDPEPPAHPSRRRAPVPASLQTHPDEDVPVTAAAITTDRLLRPGDSVQEARGFRAMLQRLLSSRARSRLEEEERHQQLMTLCRTRVPGCRRIAVISRKGGIGKTTTALMLGHQFANLRDDRVLALDANPDAGSLGDRVPSETRGTVTDILHDADRLSDYGAVRALTSRAQSGLEVVASDNDPRITEALGEEDYRRVVNVLANHYSVLVCDTGTGILDSATRGLLNQADQIVLCATQSVDASRVSALTLDWMDQNGYEHLVKDAVVSINAVHTGLADIDRLQAYFERRCRAVVRIPWDMRLALGAETTLEELQPATQVAYLNLAAMVAAGFGR